IDPGTDSTYFTSDDTYDELHPGAINNAIRYTGQRFDAESGLMYYKNRYYDPAAGRVIGGEPLVWSEGPNRYGYVGGMPAMAAGPVGLFRMSDVMPSGLDDFPGKLGDAVNCNFADTWNCLVSAWQVYDAERVKNYQKYKREIDW